jgi:hypothetical protein
VAKEKLCRCFTLCRETLHLGVAAVAVCLFHTKKKEPKHEELECCWEYKVVE